MTVPVRAAEVRDRGSKTSVRPRVRTSAPATAGDDRRAKPTAAQRAYARRNQRAALGAAAPDRTRGTFTARIPFVAIIIGLLSVGLAVTLLLTTRAAEDSYKLSAAKAHNQELTEQKAALERDFRAANSAPELARKAAALGMIPAKDVARLVVAEDGAVTVVGTPAPAQGVPVVVPPAAPVAGTATNTAATGTTNVGTRGTGTAPASLPPVGSRVAAPVAPAAPAVPASAPAAVAPAPAQAATPVAANQPQTRAQDGPLVSTGPGGQAGNQGGTR
ncbi:hypothetical protein ACFYVR_18055 [Rhodococcus sp. NPDC003318]|uniref:hypothetical protein n=1 Tax=Rhodococcus sp. NPDC003318 TaxID=3364503 RepID=UPI00368FA551